MKNLVFTGLIFIVLGILSACDSGDKAQSQLVVSSEAELLAAYNERMEGLKTKLVGKKSLVIESLLEDSVSNNTEDYLLMVLTLYDCSSCVKKGNALLESYYESPSITPVTVVSGILVENRLVKEVTDYIHDSKSTIVGDLGFFPTPFLIQYNLEGGIRDVYFIPTLEEKEKFEAFESNFKNIK